MSRTTHVRYVSDDRQETFEDDRSRGRDKLPEKWVGDTKFEIVPDEETTTEVKETVAIEVPARTDYSDYTDDQATTSRKQVDYWE